MTTSTKDVYEVGESPPIGEVPEQMYAQVIRRERFGEPAKAFQIEQEACVESPAIGIQTMVFDVPGPRVRRDDLLRGADHRGRVHVPRAPLRRLVRSVQVDVVAPGA